MITLKKQHSPSALARWAGIFYLGTIITGVFAGLFVAAQLIVPGDAAATASNIRAADELYRFGIAAEILSAIFYLAVTYYFYVIFNAVDRVISGIAALFSIAGSIILTVNTLNLVASLLLLSPDATYLSAFSDTQIAALLLFFIKLHSFGYAICLMFFGIYCCLIGYLILKASFMPTIFGTLMILGGLSYLLFCGAKLVSPSLYNILPDATTLVALVAEGALCLRLIISGVDHLKWDAQSSASLSLGKPDGIRLNPKMDGI